MLSDGNPIERCEKLRWLNDTRACSTEITHVSIYIFNWDRFVINSKVPVEKAKGSSTPHISLSSFVLENYNQKFDCKFEF